MPGLISFIGCPQFGQFIYLPPLVLHTQRYLIINDASSLTIVTTFISEFSRSTTSKTPSDEANNCIFVCYFYNWLFHLKVSFLLCWFNYKLYFSICAYTISTHNTHSKKKIVFYLYILTWYNCSIIIKSCILFKKSFVFIIYLRRKLWP